MHFYDSAAPIISQLPVMSVCCMYQVVETGAVCISGAYVDLHGVAEQKNAAGSQVRLRKEDR